VLMLVAKCIAAPGPAPRRFGGAIPGELTVAAMVREARPQRTNPYCLSRLRTVIESAGHSVEYQLSF
jgi:hypothetical protein